MVDWQTWFERLDTVGDDDIDDAVDELAGILLASPADQAAISVALKALSVAKSDLSVRSAAFAVAFVAPDDSLDAAEGLERAYETRKQHVFLAPSLLSALALLGLRNDSARAGAVRYLLRLQPTAPPPLLVAGVKAMGLLCDRENDAKLRAKLFALAGVEDNAVKAEARQQVALIQLSDALMAETHDGLIASLTAAREAFRLAESSEEVRADATLFRLLLDAVLAFDDLERDRNGALRRIGPLVVELRQMGGRTAERIFQMDRSPAAAQIAHRCEIVASSVEAAANEAARATGWTNFDKSVVRLAECYGDIRFRPSALLDGHY